MKLRRKHSGSDAQDRVKKANRDVFESWRYANIIGTPVALLAWFGSRRSAEGFYPTKFRSQTSDNMDR
jgi:hypothetical protein